MTNMISIELSLLQLYTPTFVQHRAELQSLYILWSHSRLCQLIA